MVENFDKLLEEHYRKNKEKLVKYYGRRLGSYEDAEDIVQEAYLKALRFKDNYDDAWDLSTWIGVILTNIYKDFRKTKDGMGYDLEEAEVNIEKDSILEDLYRKSINGMNKFHKNVVNKYYKMGYTIREISLMFEVTESAVKAILYRFRKRVRNNEKLYFRHRGGQSKPN